jgi:5-methylcytosine-specific restriction endonuclease McrA
MYVERRKLVSQLLKQHPQCQRCATKKSTEVHEVLSRARGGSILDPSNCVALCHECHSWITTHPKEAQEQGWLKNSWEK